MPVVFLIESELPVKYATLTLGYSLFELELDKIVANTAENEITEI